MYRREESTRWSALRWMDKKERKGRQFGWKERKRKQGKDVTCLIK
jgi:hypothetical protein